MLATSSFFGSLVRLNPFTSPHLIPQESCSLPKINSTTQTRPVSTEINNEFTRAGEKDTGLIATSAIKTSQPDSPSVSFTNFFSREIPHYEKKGSLPANVALAQIDVIAGRPDINVKKILEEIKSAKDRGVKVIIFPEMAVPGYMIGDHWKYDELVDECMAYNEDIREASRGITVIWGSCDADPDKINNSGSRRLYNAAFIAKDGAWVSNGILNGRTYKTLLPNYGKFDDKRYFHSLEQLAREEGKTISDYLQPFAIELDGKIVKIGLALCEDMWQDDYFEKPVDTLIANGADIIVDLSCSPWTRGKAAKRQSVISEAVSGSNTPLILVNNVGTQNIGKTMFVFDGSSGLYRGDGALLHSAAFFAEQTIEFNLSEALAASPLSKTKDDNIASMYQALIYGMRKFYGDRRVVIGLSGGIDSALATTMLRHALGADKVFAVNMPSEFNSELTKNDAFRLARNLGVHYAVVPIQELVELTYRILEETRFVRMGQNVEVTLKDLTPPRTRLGRLKFKIQSWIKQKMGWPDKLQYSQTTLSDLNKENVQARARGGTILAGLASMFHGWITNQSNFDEASMGYTTIYGDLVGALAMFADIGKDDIYALAEYHNQLVGYEEIPVSIIKRKASPELSKDHNVAEGKGSPFQRTYHGWLFRTWQAYHIHPESILRMYVNDKWDEGVKLIPRNRNTGELHASPRAFIHDTFKTREAFVEDLEKCWNLFHSAVFKRIQAPPVLSITRDAYGFDFREAQMAPYLTRGFKKIKQQILSEKKE